jgi:hypothetical protein
LKRIYLIFILVLITGIGGSAILWLLSSKMTKIGSNLSNIVGFMMPASLGKGISHVPYASIIWLLGSAMMGLLGIIFCEKKVQKL